MASGLYKSVATAPPSAHHRGHKESPAQPRTCPGPQRLPRHPQPGRQGGTSEHPDARRQVVHLERHQSRGRRPGHRSGSQRRQPQHQAPNPRGVVDVAPCAWRTMSGEMAMKRKGLESVLGRHHGIVQDSSVERLVELSTWSLTSASAWAVAVPEPHQGFHRHRGEDLQARVKVCPYLHPLPPRSYHEPCHPEGTRSRVTLAQRAPHRRSHF